jgi:hypothetical protein
MRRPRCQPTISEVWFRHAAKKSRLNRSLNGLRLRDLRIVRENLYGEVIPQTPMGRALCREIALHASYAAVPVRCIRGLMRAAAPWMSPEAVADLTITMLAVDDIGRRIEWYPSADQLGWRLGITRLQRERWGLTTIGSVDDTSAKRKARRKARNIAAKAKARLAKGVKPRAEANVRVRPWLACGMSERTWYRRGKPLPREASEVAPVKNAIRSLAEMRVQRISISCPRSSANRPLAPKTAHIASPSAQRGLTACLPHKKRSFG